MFFESAVNLALILLTSTLCVLDADTLVDNTKGIQLRERHANIMLIDEALGKEVKVAVCSTSNEKAVSNPAIPTLKCFRRGYVGLGVTTYIYNIQENNIFQF